MALDVVPLGPFKYPHGTRFYSPFGPAYYALQPPIERVLDHTLNLTHDVVGNGVRFALVDNTLSLTHDATAEVIKLASSDLTLTDSAVGLGVFFTSVEDTLVLSHEVIGVGRQIISNDISLTDEAVCLVVYNQASSHSLSITDSSEAGFFRDGVAENTATLTHSVVSLLVRFGAADHTLSLTHDVIGVVPSHGISAINLSHNASYQINKVGIASSSLNVTHTASQNFKFASVQNTLVLTQLGRSNTNTRELLHYVSIGHEVTAFINVVRVSHDLTLSDSARPNIQSLVADNTLVLTHATHGTTLTQFAVDQLQLTHAANGYKNPITVSRAHFLTLNDEVASELRPGGAIVVEVIDTLELTDAVSPEQSVYNVSISQDIELTDAATRDVPESVENTLTITDEATASYGVENTIDLTQSVVVLYSVTAQDTLLLSDAVGLSLVVSYALADTLVIQHSATARETNPNLCSYNPIVTPGNANYAPPSVTPPTFVIRSTVVFTYPYASPTITLTLRTPDVQDIEKFDYARVQRETRGGTQKLYRKAAWPKSRTLTYTISFSTRAKANDFVAFIEESLGKEVGLLDYLDRQWRGIILTPESGFDNESRGNRSMTFDFEGLLV